MVSFFPWNIFGCQGLTAFVVDKNVSVMTVFELVNIGDYAVRCEGSHESIDSGFIRRGIFFAECLDEMVLERYDGNLAVGQFLLRGFQHEASFEGVYGGTVGDGFD